MAYLFFLDNMQLPVTPGKLEMKFPSKNDSVNLVAGGDATVLKEPGLTEISFTAMFPNTQYPFANYNGTFKNSVIGEIASKILKSNFNYQPAQAYLQILETLKVTKKPFYFIVTRTTPGGKMLFNTAMQVSLEDYSQVEDATDGLDVTVEIQLKKFKFFGTKELEISKDKDGNTVAKLPVQRMNTKAIENAINVQKGQSIFAAVKKATNGTLDWKTIANLNEITQTFKIPDMKKIILSKATKHKESGYSK